MVGETLLSLANCCGRLYRYLARDSGRHTAGETLLSLSRKLLWKTPAVLVQRQCKAVWERMRSQSQTVVEESCGTWPETGRKAGWERQFTLSQTVVDESCSSQSLTESVAGRERECIQFAKGSCSTCPETEREAGRKRQCCLPRTLLSEAAAVLSQ